MASAMPNEENRRRERDRQRSERGRGKTLGREGRNRSPMRMVGRLR